MICLVYCRFLDLILLWVVTIRFVIFYPAFLHVERTNSVKVHVNAASFSCLASGNYGGCRTLKIEFSLGVSNSFLPISQMSSLRIVSLMKINDILNYIDETKHP